MNSKQSTAKTDPIGEQWRQRLREGAFIAVVSVCVYFFLALMSYSTHDPGWSRTAAGVGRIHNAGGITGAYLADISFYLFGFMAFLFPVLLAYRAWLIFRNRHHPEGFDAFHIGMRVLGFAMVIVAACALAWINGAAAAGLPQGAGGVLGEIVGRVCRDAFSLIGGRLVLVAMLLFGITVFTDLSWLALMDRIGRLALHSATVMREYVERWRDRRAEKQALGEQKKRRETALRQEQVQRQTRRPPTIAPAPKPPPVSTRVQHEKQKTLFDGIDDGGEPLPRLELLNSPDANDRKGYSADTLEAMSRLLELKLKDFNVIAEVVAVYPGPVITRFEIQPAPGIKVSKISNLAKDLARSLAVISVRVVEVIPGKSVVGIEIPNEDREMVYLSQILASKAYEEARSSLTLALGHDISGAPVCADLARMPHLLVAGTTGSGKSVGVNAMLLSLLYKATPEQVRLIMVDPKMLELSVYDGIPHLLTPVITDMKDAANGLRWCVGEMERRYKLMANLGVRNLAGCNRKIRDAVERGEPIADPLWQPDANSLFEPDEPAGPPALEPIPQIVVVIDEFADMMMIVGKKVEELIARIAQKARAAGIHLILATQRPSVDVITGLIKANIPTRISFQVSSKVDSRTILDQGGAEQLLGHGDMLYLPPGTGIPIRVHGAFVADDEVHRVVAAWKKRGEPRYISDLIHDGATEYVPGFSGSADDNGDDSESDSLYDDAVRFVTESRRASISAVQRKLRIGYNRAARMIESMEAAGVVSSMGTNGQREVLAPPPPGD